MKRAKMKRITYIFENAGYMLAKGSFPERSAMAIHIPIKTSVRRDKILSPDTKKDSARDKYPDAMTNGMSGTAKMFAISAVKGIFPKAKQRVMPVKICADSVTPKI